MTNIENQKTKTYIASSPVLSVSFKEENEAVRGDTF